MDIKEKLAALMDKIKSHLCVLTQVRVSTLMLQSQVYPARVQKRTESGIFNKNPF